MLLFSPSETNHTRLAQPSYDLSLLKKTTDVLQTTLFKDETLQAGITTPHSQKSGDIHGIHESLGAGACSFDFNKDGWLDILVLTGSGNTHFFGHQEWWQNSKRSAHLYRNNKDGTFSNITKDVRLEISSITMGCAVADFDGDGLADIFFANRGVNEIWHNDGVNGFTKMDNALPEDNSWSTSATIADFNDDGLPDIYISNYLKFKPNSLTFEASSGFQPEKHPDFDATLHSGSENSLLLNKGNWTFEEAALNMGVANSQGRGLAALADDINQDGKIDIVVSNDNNSENKIYINQGGRFSDQSTEFGLASLEPSSALSPIIINKRTHYLLSSGTSNHNRVFLSSTTQSLGLNEVTDFLSFNRHSNSYEFSWPPAIADFNFDGQKDLLIPNGLSTPNDDAPSISQNQPDYALLSTGKSNFTKQNSLTDNLTSPVASSRCAISGDFNNDGSSDAFISSNNGLAQLLVNQIQHEKWVGFIFNSPAITDEITISIENKLRRYQIKNGSNGFCWQDNSRIIIPTSAGTDLSTLTISIAGEAYEIGNQLKPNHYHKLSMNGGISIVDPPTVQKNQIRLKQIGSKLAVIDLMIADGQHEGAFREIRTLLEHSIEQLNSKELVELINKLPTLYQTRLAPLLLGASKSENQQAGIAIAKQLESDLLIRWILPLIHSQDETVSCSASNAFTHFFAEEEAMTIAKRASLTSLIQKATDNSPSSTCAIDALGEAEQYRSVSPLLKLLNSSNSKTRLSSIIALGRIRERAAEAAFKDKLFETKFSQTEKIELLKSIQHIAPSFKLLEHLKTVNTQINNAELLSIASAATSNRSPLPRSEQKELQDWLKVELNDSLETVTDNERIQYALIIQGQEGIQVLNKIKGGSNSISLIKAFIELDNKYRAKHLVDALNINNQLKVDLSQFTDFNLTDTDFNKISKPDSIPLETLTHYAKFVSLSDAKKLIVDELKQSNPSRNAARYKALINSVSIVPDNEICKAIQANFNQSTEIDLLLPLLNKQPILLDDCSQKYNSPFNNSDLLKLLYSSTSKLKEVAAKLLNMKQDRASRELILNTIQNQSVPSTVKTALVRTLPRPLSRSRIEVLKSIIKTNNDTQLEIDATIQLASNARWLDRNKSQLGERIKNALKTNNEVLAIGLSRILFDSDPKQTMALLQN